MKPLCLFIFTAVVAMCFISCAGHKKEDEILKGMGAMLENSNRSIENACRMLYLSIDDKSANPESSEQFKRILPKTSAIRKASAAMIEFIEQIKSEIQKKTAYTDNFKIRYHEEDKTSVKEVLTGEKISDLFNKLAAYKIEMLQIDSMSAKQFSNNTLFNTVTGTG